MHAFARPSAAKSAVEGRFALVIGGSGGIGRAVAHELSRRGASLLIHGRHASQKKDDFGDSPHEFFDCEFINPRDFIDALDAHLASSGDEPDIIACAFGPFLEKPLAQTTIEEWEWLAHANLVLPGALVSRYFAGMKRKSFGRFLFFGGTRTDTIRGFKKTAAYAAAKTGLGVLGKSIAMEGSAQNVAAVVVCPGPTETEYQDEETKARHASFTQNGTLADARQIAEIAVNLIDQDPCLASGSIVSLDCGFSP
jgi:3-oxoacyl-[acyl-carrier protein] reductase